MQIVRESFKPNLTVGVLHFQEAEIFSFLRKTAVLASPCGLRSGDPTTAMPLLPCHPHEFIAMGILGAVL